MRHGFQIGQGLWIAQLVVVSRGDRETVARSSKPPGRFCDAASTSAIHAFCTSNQLRYTVAYVVGILEFCQFPDAAHLFGGSYCLETIEHQTPHLVSTLCILPLSFDTPASMLGYQNSMAACANAAAPSRATPRSRLSICDVCTYLCLSFTDTKHCLCLHKSG